jgi:hypothetical protein
MASAKQAPLHGTSRFGATEQVEAPWTISLEEMGAVTGGGTIKAQLAQVKANYEARGQCGISILVTCIDIL